MNLSPFVAQLRQDPGQLSLDAGYVPKSETIVAAKFRWSLRTVQDKHHLLSVTDHVNVRGSMIVRMDGYAQSCTATHGRHVWSIN